MLLSKERLQHAVIENESNALAYLQLGLPRLLANYEASKKNILDESEKIRQLTSDNPPQQLRIDSLREFLAQRIVFTDSILGSKEDSGRQAAAGLLLAGNAKLYMGHVEDLLSSIQNEENRLFEFGKSENQHAVAVARVAFVFFVLAVLAALVVLSWKARGGTVDKQQKKSEAMFRGLLESAPDAMVIANDKGQIVLINRQTEILFGYTKEELIGKSVNILIPVELKEVHSRHMAAFNSEPRAREMGAGRELQALKKDGSKFPVEISLSPLKTEDGVLVSASVRDISNRIKAEQKFRGLLDAAPDATVIVDETGTMQLVNKQAEKLFGYTREEMIGQRVEILIPDGVRHKHVHHRDGFIKDPKVRAMGAAMELYARRKDGVDFPVEISLSPIKTADGLLVSASVRDITSRIKAEQKFRGLLDAAPDATVIVDETGTMQLVNKQAEKLFGYTREEMIGQRVEILIPDGVRHKHVHHRDGFIKDPKVRAMGAAMELYARRKDGVDFPVEISLSPIKTADGLLVSASVRDITSRIKAEQRFRGLLDAAPDATVIVGESGAMQLVNMQAEKVFGYTREEMIGQQVEILIPDGVRHKHVHHRDGFIKDPKVRTMGAAIELFARRKDGTNFPVEISLSPIKTTDGLLVSASVRDITERKKSEAQIEHLARLVEDTNTAIFSCDTEFVAKSWNKAAEELYGFRAAEVIGKSIIPVVRSDSSIERSKAIVKDLEEKGLWTGELTHLDKNSNKLFLLVSITSVRNTGGEIDGYVFVCRDITERKLLEEQLKKTNAELEAFSYSVSHDLRAPVRGIIGFANILDEEYSAKLDDEARRITAVIKREGLKMGNLIDDLLAFSRMGRQEIVKSDVDTGMLVQEIVAGYVAVLPVGGIEWVIGDLPVAPGDMSLLRQVWINLISNAIKYSRNRPDPCIKIGHYDDSGQTVFFVSDNGVGFNEKYKNKLFRVFQRLHSVEEFEGTGVGLAIAEKIISRHGGKIWAVSEEGKGATFYFSLPGK